MSTEPGRHDPLLAISMIALVAVAATLGYAPWILASLILATITLTITTLADARAGLAARRAGVIGVMLLIPAGLQVYAFYHPFLHAYNPHHAILPLGAAWRLDALVRYPALLAILAVTAAALMAAIGLTYVHVQRRRGAPPMASWPQVGDHSGQYSAGQREGW